MKGLSAKDLHYKFNSTVVYDGGGGDWPKSNAAQGSGLAPVGNGVGPLVVSGMGLVRFTFEVRIPALTAGAGLTYFDIFPWLGPSNAAFQGDNLCIYDILLYGGTHPSQPDIKYASEAIPTTAGGTLTVAVGMYTPTGAVRETFFTVSAPPTTLFDRNAPVNKNTITGGGITASIVLPQMIGADKIGGVTIPRTLWVGVGATAANIDSGVFKMSVLATEA